MDAIHVTSDIKIAGENRLLRILGISFGLAITIGAIISGGVLRMPEVIAGNLGNEQLILGVWILGGAWALAGANVYAEFGTMLPKAGGGYVYLRRAFGDFIGFAGGFNDFLINICAIAYLSINVGEFFAALFPSLVAHEKTIAVASILLLAFLNWLGLREGDLTQKITSAVKVLGFSALIVACFAWGGGLADNPPAEKLVTFESNFALFAAVMLSFQVVTEAYAGYFAVVYFTEENTDPGRNVPRAMFGGILTVIVVYVLLNAALLYVLPVAQIAGSKTAGADAAGLIFGETGGIIVTVIAIVATVSVINALILYAPRVPFAMSRDGLLPSKIMRVNKGGTPDLALLLLVGLAIAAVWSGSYETFLAMTAFFTLVGDSFVCLALFIMRRREPDLPRPFRAVGYPFLPALVLIGGLIFFVGYIVSNPYNSLYALAILALIFPVYRICRRVSREGAENLPENEE
jgi:APA family basic amino acid/polyamine antiporter